MTLLVNNDSIYSVIPCYYFLSEQNEQNFDRAMLASIVGNYSFVVLRKEFSVDIKLQKDFWLDFDLLKKYVLYVEKQHR